MVEIRGAGGVQTSFSPIDEIAWLRYMKQGLHVADENHRFPKLVIVAAITREGACRSSHNTSCSAINHDVYASW